MLLYGPDYAQLVYNINRTGLGMLYVCIDDAEATSSNLIHGKCMYSPYIGCEFSQYDDESPEEYNNRINNIIKCNDAFPEFISNICEKLILGHNVMLTMSNYEPLALELIAEVINEQIGIIGYEIQHVEDIKDDMEKPYKNLLSQGVLK